MMYDVTRLTAAALSAALLTAGLTGCQEVEQPTTVLTQKQWQDVKKHILEEAPETVEHPIGATFDDKIELVGFDVDGPLEAGKPATFTWYWRALEDIDDNWQTFVHFDSSAKPYRQNLDHHPVEGLYQTSRWKKGQVIEDVQKVTLEADYPPGQAVPYIGLFKGQSRMPITNDVKKTEDRRVIGPPLTVKGRGGKTAAPTGDEARPRYTVRAVEAESVEGMEVDGKLDEPLWRSAPTLDLEAFGASAAKPTQVRAFRTADHLFIGARLADEHIWSTLDERDADTWTEEVFEVFVDPDGDGADYLELQVNPQNTVFDARFDKQLGTGQGSRQQEIDRARAFELEGLEHAVHVAGTLNDDSDTDQFWTVELKIPFKSMPGVDEPPKAGQRWATNFYRFDRPTDERTLAYAWSTEPRQDFHQVDKFGTLEFAPSNMQIREALPPEAIKKLQERLEIRKPVKPAPKPAAVE